MNRKKGNFTDKVLDRLDKLTPENLQACLLGLIKERGFLENVFNAIHEAVIVVDQQLNIRYTNKAAFTLLGVNDEFLQNHRDHILHILLVLFHLLSSYKLDKSILVDKYYLAYQLMR